MEIIVYVFSSPLSVFLITHLFVYQLHCLLIIQFLSAVSCFSFQYVTFFRSDNSLLTCHLTLTAYLVILIYLTVLL